MRVTINEQFISKAKNKTLSPLQKEYRKFVKKKLKETGKTSPFQGSEDEIIDFLDELSKEWKKYKKENNLKTKSES